MIKWLNQRAGRLQDRSNIYIIVLLFILNVSSIIPQSTKDEVESYNTDRYNKYTQGEFTIYLPKDVGDGDEVKFKIEHNTNPDDYTYDFFILNLNGSIIDRIKKSNG